MSLICSTVNSESDFVIAVFFYLYCIFLCVEEGKKEKKKREEECRERFLVF